MSIRRITISVPKETALRIKKAAGKAPVSAWVTGLIEDQLAEAQIEEQWQAFYESVKPSRAAVKRAEALHQRLTKPRRKKGAA